jgi:hypothetical protein
MFLLPKSAYFPGNTFNYAKMSIYRTEEKCWLREKEGKAKNIESWEHANYNL